MRTYFKAEILKYRHTRLKGLLILMPFASVFLAAWLTHRYFIVDSYNWWYTGLYPGMIGIMCGIIGGKDKKKKNAAIWSLPCRMEKVWDAKVLTGAAMSGIAMASIVLFTIAGQTAMEGMLHITFILQPSVQAQLAAGVLIWLTALWQIPFCLLLAQKMGIFWMFLLHMGSSVLISATISLKPWFALVPGAITSRLMCPILGVLPNGLPAAEGQMTYFAEIVDMQNLFIGIPAAVFWFTLFWWGSRRWFQRQVTV